MAQYNHSEQFAPRATNVHIEYLNELWRAIFH